jgi:hypothetical protein
VKPLLLCAMLVPLFAIGAMTSSVESQLGLCPMMVNDSIDVQCVVNNQVRIDKAIDELLFEIRAEDKSNDIYPALPEIVAAGRLYIQNYCQATTQMMAGQGGLCIVRRQLDLLRDVACVASWPMQSTLVATRIESYCPAL